MASRDGAPPAGALSAARALTGTVERESVLKSRGPHECVRPIVGSPRRRPNHSQKPNGIPTAARTRAQIEAHDLRRDEETSASDSFIFLPERGVSLGRAQRARGVTSPRPFLAYTLENSIIYDLYPTASLVSGLTRRSRPLPESARRPPSKPPDRGPPRARKTLSLPARAVSTTRAVARTAAANVNAAAAAWACHGGRGYQVSSLRQLIGGVCAHTSPSEALHKAHPST